MPALLDHLYNFHWLTPEAARSAQPYLGFFEPFLTSHGVRAILNLRGENPAHGWWRHEKALAARLGIAHYDIRLSSRLLPSREAMMALMDAFDTAPRPFLLKCSGGQDRTGLAAALFLLEQLGPAGLIQAERQLTLWPYLHVPRGHQKWLRQFPAYAALSAREGSVSDWVRRHYAPEAFATWLEARGAGGHYRTLQVSR